MKNKRFIELINLCVDHQLTPAEARELENELHTSPARQRTYLQYCRMQKACAQLFEIERANAPAHPRLARALADANRKVTAAPFHKLTRHPSPWWRNLFAIGGLAAAATCMAVIFVLQKTPRQPAAAPAAVVAAPVVAGTTPHPTTPAIAAPEAQPQPASAIAAITIAPASADTADIAAMPQTPAATIAIQTPPKRFRLPTITSFTPDQNTPPKPFIDETAFVWTRDLQFRPIRKISTENAISVLRRFEKPQPGASLLLIPSAETQEPATEMTAIEFKQ
jgi:anti-sigma factor RsiW